MRCAGGGAAAARCGARAELPTLGDNHPDTGGSRLTRAPLRPNQFLLHTRIGHDMHTMCADMAPAGLAVGPFYGLLDGPTSPLQYRGLTTSLSDIHL